MSRIRSGRRGEKNMSGVGGIGGVGGAGAAHAPGAGAGAAGASNTQVVTPSKGAGGVSDDGGKNSLAIGDQNLIGNTQNQTVNNTNNYYGGMNTQDFCSLHNSSVNESQGAFQSIGEMSTEDMQKMLLIIMIMKMLEAFMENSGGGGQSGVQSAAGAGVGASAGASAGGAGGGAGEASSGGQGGYSGVM